MSGVSMAVCHVRRHFARAIVPKIASLAATCVPVEATRPGARNAR